MSTSSKKATSSYVLHCVQGKNIEIKMEEEIQMNTKTDRKTIGAVRGLKFMLIRAVREKYGFTKVRELFVKTFDSKRQDRKVSWEHRGRLSRIYDMMMSGCQKFTKK